VVNHHVGQASERRPPARDFVMLVAVHALKRSAVVIAGFNTAGFAVTALTQSHKITDLTVCLPTDHLYLHSDALACSPGLAAQLRLLSASCKVHSSDLLKQQ